MAYNLSKYLHKPCFDIFFQIYRFNARSSFNIVILSLFLVFIFGGENYKTHAANNTFHPILVTGTERKITNSTANQKNPDISGDKIVWEDYRNGNADIYLYDLATGTERQITTDNTNQTEPAISGNRIVWEDARNGGVYLYDLATNTEQQITSNLYAANPKIFGNTIIWYSGDSIGLYSYDISNNIQQIICDNNNARPDDQFNILNNNVVWGDGRNSQLTGKDIYLCDLTTMSERRITDSAGIQLAPAISADKIAYLDNRNGSGWDVYLYDSSTNTEYPLVVDLTYQFHPSISGNYVVWDEVDTINFYDLTSNAKEVIAGGYGKNGIYYSPEIDGNRVVWYDSRNGNWDVYLYEIGVVNGSPVLSSIGSKTIDEGKLLEFVVSATDPDNNVLTYDASTLPSGATFDKSTRVFSWTPGYNQSGVHNIIFTVSDDSLSDSETVAITVNDINHVNHAPVLEQIGSKVIEEGKNLEITINGSDPDGDALTYVLSDLPSGAIFNAATQAFSWTPGYNQSGVYNIIFTVSDGELSDHETITIAVLDSSALDNGIIVGPHRRGGPQLRLFDFEGKLTKQFFAYEKSMRGGLDFVTEDLDNDGKKEIITGPGVGREPEVRIFNSDGKRINQFLAYSKNFRGGVNIAAGDLNGDGKKEIITSSQNGAPLIRIFSLNGNKWVSIKSDFFAYPKNIVNGVNIVVADIDGDGIGEIVAAPSKIAPPALKIFGLRDNKIKQTTTQIYVFSKTFRGGVNLSSGDLNNDGKEEILVSPATKGNPRVKIYGLDSSDKISLLSSGFLAFDNSVKEGVDTTVANIRSNGLKEIITVPAGQGQPLVRIFSSDKFIKSKEFKAYPDKFITGLRVETW